MTKENYKKAVEIVKNYRSATPGKRISSEELEKLGKKLLRAVVSKN